jgi:tetratricopeptide (TPR) repeat protein
MNPFNTFILGLLLQSPFQLPPRTAMENPVSVSSAQPKSRKDYDKLWLRFVAAKDDAKLQKDLDKFLQKQKTFDPAWTLHGYVHLYRGEYAAARQKLLQAIVVNSNNRIAMYYLAELAFAHAEYSRAAGLYAQLQAIDRTYPEIETKRQKAILLATDNFLRAAARAESEDRLGEAEEFYKQALVLAPNEPSLEARLADLLMKLDKKEEAEALRGSAVDHSPPTPTRRPDIEKNRRDDLEDLGRWGSEIEVFNQIRSTEAVSRQQFATLIVRYFPQIAEFRPTPPIMTDLNDATAIADIIAVTGVGLMSPLPNRRFEPLAPLSRSDLAAAIARLARVLGLTNEAPTVPTPDVPETNAAYPEVQFVLGGRIMSLEDSGGFNLNGHVTGIQAVLSTERLLGVFQQAQR